MGLGLSDFNSDELHFNRSAGNPFAWDFVDEHNLSQTSIPVDELGWITTAVHLSGYLSATIGGILSISLFLLVLFRTKGPLQNYRRMLLLCSTSDLIYWSRPLSVQHTALLFFMAVTMAVPMGILSYISHRHSAEIRPDFNYATLWYRQVPVPQLLFADSRLYWTSVYAGFGTVLVTFDYALAIFFAVKTMNFLRTASKHFSVRTHWMQKQLSNALFFQALLPVVVSITPVIFLCVSTSLHAEVGRAALFFTSVWTWVPVANPLLTIFAIVPYRRVVLGLFGLRKTAMVYTSSEGFREKSEHRVSIMDRKFATRTL